jgi:hypothetical protein
MSWLTQQGPYWDDDRLHDSDMWLQVNELIVTETALGEAAICLLHGVLREVVSCTPSDWTFTPIDVRWIRATNTYDDVEVTNHWEITSVEHSLAACRRPINSWISLAAECHRQYDRLTIAADAFQPLNGFPFAPAAAHQIRLRLGVLDRLGRCFEQGARNAEGNRIYQDYFTGENAWFSDSSASEKSNFRAELTFAHPEWRDASLFCPMHGKVRPYQIRIHFFWPIREQEPIFVVYVGPKLTKQ